MAFNLVKDIQAETIELWEDDKLLAVFTYPEWTWMIVNPTIINEPEEANAQVATV